MSNNGLIIGFDCQGVLIADGKTPEIIESRTAGLIMPKMVKHLVLGGAECHLISACPKGHHSSVENLCKLMRWHKIPIHGIWPAWIEAGSTPFEVGVVKANIINEIKCDLFFDDVQDVVEGIRSCGKIAIHYSINWE